jgi:hypothetical protein
MVFRLGIATDCMLEQLANAHYSTISSFSKQSSLSVEQLLNPNSSSYVKLGKLMAAIFVQCLKAPLPIISSFSKLSSSIPEQHRNAFSQMSISLGK